MSPPSLGYEGDAEIAKAEIGRIQLIEAIRLFLEGKFVCSITLAGAAEAILAGVLANLGKSSSVEDATEAIDRIRGRTEIPPMGGLPDNKIYNGWNAARNGLKHHGKDEAPTVRLNLFDEAYWMIQRALANAEKAGIDIPNATDFENWIILNINL